MWFRVGSRDDDKEGGSGTKAHPQAHPPPATVQLQRQLEKLRGYRDLAKVSARWLARGRCAVQGGQPGAGVPCKVVSKGAVCSAVAQTQADCASFAWQPIR